ncbi:F-box protein At1g48060 isoform X2 [Capsella rubella]|nr:F-box protein At1g48060 isoform X2 [Capsella rubella]
MKRREEDENQNMQRKRSKPSSSSSLSIPLDLTSEIFLRLPAKSVVRFSCVSKLWSSITTEPYFTNAFETRPNLLFFFKEDNRLFVVTVPPLNKNPKESYSYSSSPVLDTYQIPYPKGLCFTIKTESVHGLICFQKATQPILWNPTMRKFSPLPKPDTKWEALTVFLGYDPVEGKHKVLAMQSNKASDECRVLTVESGKKSWRTVKPYYAHQPCRGHRKDNYGPCRCINGVLYYGAKIGLDRVIMNKLAYLGCSSYGIKTTLRMLVLEDERRGWSSHKFLPISHYDRGAENNFKLIGVTNDGELIYVPNTVFGSFDVVYIDPVKETYRRVKYKGVADREFRQRNGLEDLKAFRGIQYSPNHIETLMSL